MISNRLKKITSLVLVLVLGLIVIGCTNRENGYSDLNIPEGEETIEQEAITESESASEDDLNLAEDLIADLNYRFMRVLDYTEPLIDLPRDYGLAFELTPEATKKIWERFANDDGIVLISDFLRVYRDSALTQEVFFRAEGDGDRFLDITTLTINPPRVPAFTIFDPGADERLFCQGEYNDWGNAKQYFLVRDVDFTTGELLERPLVTVFSIATEIVGAPRVEFHMSEDGRAGLVWDPVPGATEYVVVRVSECKYGRAPGRTSFLWERTTNTYWVDELTGPHEINGNFSFLSSRATSNFDTFLNFMLTDVVSEREWTLEEVVEEYWRGLCFEPERHAELEWYFGVIALNSEGTSSISNLIDVRIVNSQVPIFVAIHLNEGGVTPTGVGTDTQGTVYGDVLQAPSHAWNRVRIDGQWYTLDVTNNDNEFFPNAFFNLSDQEASTILTEDSQWMLDRELPRFVATSETLTEYYRHNQRFFDLNRITRALVEGINAHGRATYRTTVLLTEERFQEVMEEVIRETGNSNLVGGHFLGVITVMEN